MWGDEQPQPSPPGAAPTTRAGVPVAPRSPSDATHLTGGIARSAACLGPGLQVKGEISGNEDLYLEGKVEGSISLGGHRLTVGRNAQVSAEVVAREVIVYGQVSGDLRGHDRIEIKKDASVTGDVTTARILVEDGAYLKGKIETDRSGTPVGTDLNGLLSRSTPGSD
jgi:cytoskeletal protein CcmA (bactofilin family)